MKSIFSILLILTVVSCNNTETKIVLQDRMASFSPKERDVIYFHADTVTGERNILESWGNRVLFSLNEPVLFNYVANGEFIRFVWLRSFENPIIIRVNKFSDTVYAVIKELKLQTIDTMPPVVLKDTIITLDKELWQNVMKPIDTSDFWSLQYADSSLNEDGAVWFLECSISNRYKVIRRWDNGHLLSEPFRSYLLPLINLVPSNVKLQTSR